VPAVAVLLGVTLSVGVTVLLDVAVLMTVALLVGVPGSVGVAVLVDVAVLVGVAVSVGVAVLLGVAVAVGVGLLVGEGLLLGGGVVFVGVGVGDGLGDFGSVNCWHCSAVPLTTLVVGDPLGRLVLDSAAGAATENNVAVAMRTLPVTRLTLTGRTCAKRMKALPVLLVAAAERLIQYGVAASGDDARLVRYAHYWTPDAVPGATVTTTQ
jgi:hypothetical protein